MKDRIDFKTVSTLLKKQFWEWKNGAKKGNFDAVGLALRLVLIAMFLAIFVFFFGRFGEIYLDIPTGGRPDVGTRTEELLTFMYTATLIFTIIGGMSQINKEIFSADDMNLYPALPVGASSLFISKLAVIYVKQLLMSAIVVLPVNITLGVISPQSAYFYGMTALMILVLPLLSLAIASFLSLPMNAIKQFFKYRFVSSFILTAIIAAGLLALYYFLLAGVKELLLGDNLKYFFNEKLMTILGKTASALYPAKFFADFILKRNMLVSGLGIFLVTAVVIVLSLVLTRTVMVRVLQSRISGSTNFIMKPRPLPRAQAPFFTLVKKDFLQIFRTSSYMFSYFSVAIVMPMMVFACMSVGADLVTKMLGVDARLELACFLTLLFGALTNMFCSTNISREGEMFYSVKAMPVKAGTVFFSKVFLCMLVATFSQLVSAILLVATKYVPWYGGLFLFAAGIISGFAEICLATRFDFNHARFFTEENGVVREHSDTASVIIVISLVFSFLVGGAVVVLRMYGMLHSLDIGYLTYVIVAVTTCCAAALAYYYLIRQLNKKYYEFSGGGL